MISLRDTIEIRSTPDLVFAWLASMPQQYALWHPDHVACRVLKGSMVQVGSEVECQEYLHGKAHTMRFRLTRVDPGRRLEYEIVGMGRGAFEIVQKGENVDFVGELDLGSQAPIVGGLTDLTLNLLFPRRIGALRQHMSEEGTNLKRILESGWHP